MSAELYKTAVPMGGDFRLVLLMILMICSHWLFDTLSGYTVVAIAAKRHILSQGFGMTKDVENAIVANDHAEYANRYFVQKSNL